MLENYYLCGMKQTTNNDMYKCLATYVLPEGVLEYFSLTEITEEDPKSKAADPLYKKELHIYLDERDNRTEDMAGSTSKGFTDESFIYDFPIRTHKTVIHIRRRRWLMPDGTSKIINLEKHVRLTHPGTRYSNEFALFLKLADGQ